MSEMLDQRGLAAKALDECERMRAQALLHRWIVRRGIRFGAAIRVVVGAGFAAEGALDQALYGDRSGFGAALGLDPGFAHHPCREEGARVERQVGASSVAVR